MKSYFLLLPLFAIQLNSFSQGRTVLKPSSYNKIVKSDARVRILSFKNGRVNESENTTIDQATIPVKGKSVAMYGDKRVTAIEPELYRQFTTESKSDVAPDQVLVIPEIHYDNGASTTGEITAYRIVFASLEPLRYNPSAKKFSSKIGFFLMPDAGNTSNNISQPVNVDVVSNDIRTITPGHLQISHFNIPYADVNLSSDDVIDSVGIKVITTSNPDGYIAFLKVKPGLDIYSSRSKLQGYGIQSIPIDVRLMGSSSEDSIKVTWEEGLTHPQSFTKERTKDQFKKISG